ncbi:hypothetical protein ACF1BE_19850 [Streptomyces sp. NPDC014991]|uniref:hypothetical protein n=1 Tax=Streptomyces sp. NPDC014991 TaxID=3364935 RepID=UPI0036F56A22
MARLQILQLPEGVDDSRPPFALVVDQCAADRWVSRPGNGDQLMSTRWREAAEMLGARGVIVTAETVEIPANEVPLPEPLELVADVDRMDEITDALGLDQLRDWGEIVEAAKRARAYWEQYGHDFHHVDYQDPQRCSRCGIERLDWAVRRDSPTCAEVRAVKGGE